MPSKSKPAIRVGVGGWTFEPWRGTFYPEGLPQKRELEYASRKLTSIEINGTYYGSQKPESFTQVARRDAGRLRLLGEGPALRHQPPRAGRSGRIDRALLHQRRAGAEGQARADQLAVRADQEVRSRRLRRPSSKLLPKQRRGPRRPPRGRGAARELRGAGVRRARCASTGSPSWSPAIATIPQIADITAPFVYARIMGTTREQPAGYPPDGARSPGPSAPQLGRRAAPDGSRNLSRQPRRRNRRATSSST